MGSGNNCSSGFGGIQKLQILQNGLMSVNFATGGRYRLPILILRML
jgi:hypothetical protein